jgi:hypothetical protein
MTAQNYANSIAVSSSERDLTAEITFVTRALKGPD